MNKFVEMLKGPDPFFLIMSVVTYQPYLNEQGRAYVYTDTFALSQMMSYLELSGDHVYRKLIASRKDLIFENMVCAGVTEISLNEQDSDDDVTVIDIREFVSSNQIPDNYAGENMPVINRSFSNTLNRFYQELGRKTMRKELADELFQKLKRCWMVIPVNSHQAQISGQVIFPFLAGTSTVPIFTDYRIETEFLNQAGENYEDYWSWAMNWEGLTQFVTEHPEVNFRLNENTVNLLITREMILGLESMDEVVQKNMQRVADDLSQNKQ